MTYEEKLQELGGKLWNETRIYFNFAELAKFYGLELDFFNTGNICSAKLDGEKISNSNGRWYAEQFRFCKFWYDISDRKFRSKGLSEAMFTKIVDRIKEAIEAIG